jgi:CO/xanthine dehydrogenase FAD-binding subunit
MIPTPSTLAQAVALSQAGGLFAAGRTVLRPGAAPDDNLIDISRLPGLDGIDEAADGGSLLIGALVTLERLRRDARVMARNPALVALLGLVAGLGVRTLATVGGNVGWGAGDLVPFLLAHDARLETSEGIHDADSLPAGALLLAVRLPPQPPMSFVEKAGYRAAFSPTLITVALCAEVLEQRATSVRIAAGGGVTRPQRLGRAEALLMGSALDGFDWQCLADTIEDELDTVSDALASAAHRRRVAARLITGRLVEELARGAA